MIRGKPRGVAFAAGQYSLAFAHATLESALSQSMSSIRTVEESTNARVTLSQTNAMSFENGQLVAKKLMNTVFLHSAGLQPADGSYTFSLKSALVKRSALASAAVRTRLAARCITCVWRWRRPLRAVSRASGSASGPGGSFV